MLPDELTVYVNFARLMVERDRRMELVRMGKIDEFANGVTDTLADLEQRFGGLGAKAQALKEKGETVAGRWEQHFEAQAKSLAAAEDAINRISNIPLEHKKPDQFTT